MSLFTAGDTLKVIIIGDDGIARAQVVKRDATIAGNKYIITQKDVFLQRVKKFDLFWIDQPTILFRQNSIHAVSRDGEESYPTPQETADVIENSAMHLFTIFGKETNILMILLLVLAGVAAGGGCVGAYFAYNNSKAIADNHADISAIAGQIVNITGSTSNGVPIDNSGIPTVTPKPTGTIKPSATPGLPQV
jgi:hypothetical protein